MPPADEPATDGARPARHLVLVGPTASGKSALALEMARRCPGVEVISVDSMQVYRGMDIGTAKPTAAERAAVRHHLLDVADPAERYTVARFQRDCAAALADVESRGATAVLVGGTGLYVQAAIGDLTPPGEWPEVRATLDQEPDTESLYERLRALDPSAARRMTPGNRRRVIRALEVTVGSGRPFSSFGPGLGAYPPSDRFLLVGVWLPRTVVAERVEERVATMLERGWLEEVRALAARPAGVGATARQALGYRELLAHVENGLPLEEAVALTVQRTRAFSVRQRRWFRRDPRVRWLAAGRNTAPLLPALLRQLEQCRTPV